MTESEFLPTDYTNTIESGSVTWQSPSNIALVKYWGKKANQIPANPSISFTLDICNTTTTLEYERRSELGNDFSFDVIFEGQAKDDFKPKIEKFFNRIRAYVPFITDYHFTIKTSNSFPHSSGIASSASGMSALALCLMSLEEKLISPKMNQEQFNRKASFLARLGSGSASRSIEGSLVIWGKHGNIQGSSDLYGVKSPFKIHECFNNYKDTILLVDKGEKQVSSTLGHDLMHDHPFAKERFKQANINMNKLIDIFKNGDLNGFIQIVESEALTLHAMMMTSLPYFILMKPNTLEIINKIWNFRKESGSKVCFTLDAGANVHILYPENEKENVIKFIENELVAYCQNGHYICDTIGLGAKKV